MDVPELPVCIYIYIYVGFPHGGGHLEVLVAAVYQRVTYQGEVPLYQVLWV